MCVNTSIDLMNCMAQLTSTQYLACNRRCLVSCSCCCWQFRSARARAFVTAASACTCCSCCYGGPQDSSTCCYGTTQLMATDLDTSCNTLGFIERCRTVALLPLRLFLVLSLSLLEHTGECCCSTRRSMVLYWCTGWCTAAACPFWGDGTSLCACRRAPARASARNRSSWRLAWRCRSSSCA